MVYYSTGWWRSKICSWCKVGNCSEPWRSTTSFMQQRSSNTPLVVIWSETRTIYRYLVKASLFPQQQGKEIPDRNLLKFSMESTETSLPQLPRWGPFCAHLHHKPHDCSSSSQTLELTPNQPWGNCLETPPDMGAGFLGKVLKRDFPPQPCAGVLQKSFPTRQPKQPQTHGQWKQ